MDRPAVFDSHSISILRISSAAVPNVASELGTVFPDTITFELIVSGQLAGCWTATRRDMGLELQPKDLFGKVADRFPRVSQAIEGCFQYLGWIGDLRVDAVRHILPFTSLPLRIRRGLSIALAAEERGKGELWLQFVDSSGLLPLVGWERILHAVADWPVLRLPYSQVPSIVSTSHLDVAFCCSAPSVETRPSPKELSEIAAKIVSSTRAATHCEVHVFADRFYYDELKKQIPENSPIHVYDPNRLAVPAEEPCAHPWRRWMMDELKGRAIDVFHTVTPARFSGRDEAFLLVSRQPSIREITRDDPVPVRFISSYEHAQFCAQFGAWAMVFTSFGGPAERTATAAVADGVARSRPGIVALHDSVADLFLAGVGELYRFLSEGRKAAPRSDALSVYCNPQALVSTESTAHPFWEGILSPAVTEQLATTGEVPEWLAATHRLIESSAMLYLEPSGKDENDTAARDGARNALQFISAALENIGKTRRETL